MNAVLFYTQARTFQTSSNARMLCVQQTSYWTLFAQPCFYRTVHTIWYNLLQLATVHTTDVQQWVWHFPLLDSCSTHHFFFLVPCHTRKDAQFAPCWANFIFSCWENNLCTFLPQRPRVQSFSPD